MELSILRLRALSLVCVSSALLLGAASVYADHKDAGDKKEQPKADAGPAKDAGVSADAGPKKDVTKLRKQARDAERKWLLSNAYAVPRGMMRIESVRHSSRIAKLRRIRALAEAAGDQGTIARVDALMAKEKGRHERWAKSNNQKVIAAASPSGKPAASAAPAASARKGGAK